MYRAFIVAFCAVVACGLAASQSAAGNSVRSYDYDYKKTEYDYKKCYAKYQICCTKKYECGYYDEKYHVPKKCYKDECYDEKVPKVTKKCETQYKYQKVCKDVKKDSYRPAVRNYDYSYDTKKYCYDEKYPYQHCYDYTYYDYEKKCHKKEYDCSYYDYKKVAKYCDKYECTDYKEAPVDDYDTSKKTY